MDERAIVRLVEAQGAAQVRVEDRAVAQTARVLGAVTSWGDPAVVAVLGSRLGGVARAAAGHSAALVDAYLARVMAELLDVPVAPVGPIDVSAPLRMGVEAYDRAYWRVATDARVALSKGASAAQALERARQRAEVMVRMDAGLARRQQALRVIGDDDRVIGYRRIIRPYLSRGGSCGLCIAAADRLYARGDLLPLHARCKCVVMPATKANDPGGTLNEEDLAAVYASSASNRGPDLKRVRYRVEDHGELGPTLVDAEHGFRGPDALAA